MFLLLFKAPNKKKEKLLSEQKNYLEIQRKNTSDKKQQKNKYLKENNLLSQTTAITNKQHLEIRSKKNTQQTKTILRKKKKQKLRNTKYLEMKNIILSENQIHTKIRKKMKTYTKRKNILCMQ